MSFTGFELCDFENGTLCSLIQNIDDDFNWSLGCVSTPSSGTGPTGGFNDSSCFMFTEGSSPREEFDSARCVRRKSESESESESKGIGVSGDGCNDALHALSKRFLTNIYLFYIAGYLFPSGYLSHLP